MKQVRKAIAGGFAAGVAAVVGNLVVTGAPTKDDVSKAIGTFIVAFVVGGYAVYKTKNAPAV